MKDKKIVDVGEVIIDCMEQDHNNPITDKGSSIKNTMAEIERAGETLEKILGKERLDKLLEKVEG